LSFEICISATETSKITRVKPLKLTTLSTKCNLRAHDLFGKCFSF
jgi:hypothetical protein